MKPRRVVLTIEVETDVPLKVLRDRRKVMVAVHGGIRLTRDSLDPLQIQANVIKPGKR